MFQTFSGNSRRPRQVNLSGRTSNPFAAVQSSGPSQAPGGGSGAIAHAQIERKARQHERDRLQASRTLQRVWRGHASRKELRKQLKGRIQESEERLTPLAPNQRSFSDVRIYLQMCAQAARPDAKDYSSLLWLLLAGQWICEKEEETLSACRHDTNGGQVIASIRSLVRLLLRFLDSALMRPETGGSEFWTEHQGLQHGANRALVLLAAVIRMLSLIPINNLPYWSLPAADVLSAGQRDRTVLVVEQYYRLLARTGQLRILIAPQDYGQQEMHQPPSLAELQVLQGKAIARADSSLEFLRDLLLAPGRHGDKLITTYYEPLIIGILSQKGLPERFLVTSREILDLDLYLNVASHLLQNSGHRDAKTSLDVDQALLANTIYLCNSNPESKGMASDQSKMGTGSFNVNLNFLSILSRALQNYSSVADLDPPTHEQLRRLVQAENISALFKRTDWLFTHDGQSVDAQILADYILTIIRLLPSKADEVRMWVYLSDSAGRGDGGQQGQSAIRLFWTAVSQNDVFRRSCSGSREAAELLPDRRGQSTAGTAAYRASDWNMILLFLELYSFALRIQDDEQLVAGLETEIKGKQAGSSTLNLEEMKMLVTFLKHVSFAIYTERNVAIHDAANDTVASDSANSLQASAFSSAAAAAGSANRGHTANNTPRSVSMPQLKGTATALLRMIYERDSRRKFLPPRHFIMENFESASFIDDVSRERELRAHLEREAQDSDEDTEMYDWDSRRPADRGVMISSHTLQVRRQTRIAEMRQRQSRRHLLQRAAPRIEILENIPFLVPFETRVQIFTQQVEADMWVRRNGNTDPDLWRMSLATRNSPQDAARELGAHTAELRRENVFEDAFKSFYKLGEGLKEPIKISFVDEEGIDGGGVTKEFLTSIIDEVFSVNSEHHLFAENDQHELYPYPSALDEIDVYFKSISGAGDTIDQESVRQAKREKLQFYEFVGRIVGKCLYEGILVQIPLARFFIAKWALTGGDGASRNESTFRPSINDLRDYDQDIYRSMLQIKNYSGDVNDLGIDFSVTDDVGGGERLERELKPGGSDVPVDNANRLIYIALITKHYLVDRQGPQTRAFLDGLSSIIKPTWLRMFNEAEIRTLLGGEAKPIDVEDLRRNTVYGGVYQIGDDRREHPTIRMFWEVMHEMQDSDRRKLLQYATSTPNAPLMGFAYLVPRFSIRDSMSDQGRLPTSSTCANLLKLPIYQSKELLRDKIMTAIHSNAGFDLS